MPHSTREFLQECDAFAEKYGDRLKGDGSSKKSKQ
jgi:hypothetical protein